MLVYSILSVSSSLMLSRYVAAGTANVGSNVGLRVGRATIVYTVTDAAGNSDRDVQFIDVGMFNFE
jgi:hypothetical protein